MEEEKHEVKLYQANALTESRYVFSKAEKNCLYVIMRQVRHDYIENPEHGDYKNMRVRIPKEALKDVAAGRHAQYAHDTLVKMRERSVEIHEDDGSYCVTGFINWAKWDAKRGDYEVEVSSMIMPHLVNLVRAYTCLDVTVAMALRSVYSQRLYEMCQQYKNNLHGGAAYFHKTQQQLRTMFCLEDKYPKAPDFNKFVVNKAEKEIKDLYDKGECPLWVEVFIKGRGKNMEYDFFIYTKEQEKKVSDALKDEREMKLAIIDFLHQIYPKDPKFVDRIDFALKLPQESGQRGDFIKSLYSKLMRLVKDYGKDKRANGLPAIVRYVLASDFDLT